MKYNWDNFFSLIKEEKYNDLINLLKGKILSFESPESIFQEVESKTYFIEDINKRNKCEIFLYLKLLFAYEFSLFTKEIQYNHLVAKTHENFKNKTNDIKNNQELSSDQKDEILERFDKDLEIELTILINTYQNQYLKWLKDHENEMNQYNLIKNKIESWVKNNLS